MDIIWCSSDLPGVWAALIYHAEKQRKNGAQDLCLTLGRWGNMMVVLLKLLSFPNLCYFSPHTSGTFLPSYICNLIPL